jgi:nicotinamidase/pyrazinamidase
MTPNPLEAGDALLLIDVQVDFCPGGRLPVPEGHLVVPVLNRWIEAAVERRAPVIASRDWHPRAHPSFREQGGPWPEHCVQDGAGAAFHPDLRLPADAVVVTKGTRFDRDQLSAFDETGLTVHLRARGVRRLFVGGLAQDVCVRATVLDALRERFAVRLLEAGMRAVTRGGGRDALVEMLAAGARLAEE